MNDALAVLDAIPADQLPAAVLRLTARLVATPPGGEADHAADELLTPKEAAALLKTNVRFVQRNARALGAIKLSRRKLRFSAKKVRRWIEGRR